jgi:hypothetical protein
MMPPCEESVPPGAGARPGRGPTADTSASVADCRSGIIDHLLRDLGPGSQQGRNRNRECQLGPRGTWGGGGRWLPANKPVPVAFEDARTRDEARGPRGRSRRARGLGN